MIKKKFFTKASPKAVEGIRRAYATKGATVSAVMNPQSGLATVVVSLPEETSRALAAA